MLKCKASVGQEEAPDALIRRATPGWCPPKTAALAEVRLTAATSMACQCNRVTSFILHLFGTIAYIQFIFHMPHGVCNVTASKRRNLEP